MKPNTDVLLALNDIPTVNQSITAALQHILACFVGIITPSLIIGTALGPVSYTHLTLPTSDLV